MLLYTLIISTCYILKGILVAKLVYSGDVSKASVSGQVHIFAHLEDCHPLLTRLRRVQQVLFNTM